MDADASAYSVLGLDLDADGAAIDRAYKRLIKEHHPDRAGGDAKRAAEINRAYRELRGPKARDAIELNDDALEPRARRAWKLVLAGAGAGLLAGIFLAGPLGPPMQKFWAGSTAHLPLAQGAAAAMPSDLMDEPLHLEVIDAAISEALHVARSRDEMALADSSRNCHHLLRTQPTMVQLDRCAAFDDAVVELQDRDPLRDEGPFAQLAVTGRQWSGASALSSDYLAIDGRLDRIRLHVELALASAAAPASSA
jgi:hypothetical protein